jgi:hypothetical protein
MKKIIAILFSSLMLASIMACSAADDSTITKPRMEQDSNDLNIYDIFDFDD